MPAILLAIEQHVLPGWKQTFEAIEKSENFPAQLFRREDDTAKHRIQARTIAPARQHADPGLRHLRHAKNQRVFFGSTIRPPAAH